MLQRNTERGRCSEKHIRQHGRGWMMLVTGTWCHKGPRGELKEGPQDGSVTLPWWWLQGRANCLCRWAWESGPSPPCCPAPPGYDFESTKKTFNAFHHEKLASILVYIILDHVRSDCIGKQREEDALSAVSTMALLSPLGSGWDMWWPISLQWWWFPHQLQRCPPRSWGDGRQSGPQAQHLSLLCCCSLRCIWLLAEHPADLSARGHCRLPEKPCININVLTWHNESIR